MKLKLFGGADLRDVEGRPVGSVLAQPRRLALLAYLAVAGDWVRRDTLLAIFWPESDNERARASLRQSVRWLRRSLGEAAIQARGDDELALDGARMWCDVQAFHAALRAGDRRAALDLYEGHLLEGFHVDDAPAFERWLDEERASLRRTAAAAALALSEEEGGKRIVWIRRAVDLAPDDEVAQRRLMQTLDAAGDRAGALAVFAALEQRLASEYDVQPAPETLDLVNAIRGRTRATPAAPPAIIGGDPLKSVDVTPAIQRRDEATIDVTATDPMRTRSRGAVLASAAAALVLISAVLVLTQRAASRAPTVGRVVVAPLENRTGDASLDPVGAMAADWIVQGLIETRSAEVVPMTAALASMRNVPGEAATRMQRLARETGAALVISGAYYLDGGRLQFQLRMEDAGGMTVRHALQPVTAARDSISLAMVRLREQTLAAIAPIADTSSHARASASPPSLEAYRHYVLGVEAFVSRDLQESLDQYSLAAAADSTYALPRLGAAITLMNMGRMAESDSAARDAARLRHRLGAIETEMLTLTRSWLDGDNRAGYAASVRAAALAPGTLAHYQLAEQARRINRPREALRVLRQLDPTRGEIRGWLPYWREQTYALHMLGQHQRELEAARRARELYPASTQPPLFEARALAALGRMSDLEILVQQRLASTAPESATTLMIVAAGELAAHGHDEAARRLHQRALVSLDAMPDSGAPDVLRTRASMLQRLGRLDEAASILTSLAAQHPDDYVTTGMLGVVAAARGDHTLAERADEALAANRQPYLEGGPSYWRACIAAQLGDADAAVAHLRAALEAGMQHGLRMHSDWNLRPLSTHADFQALLKPEG